MRQIFPNSSVYFLRSSKYFYDLLGMGTSLDWFQTGIILFDKKSNLNVRHMHFNLDNYTWVHLAKNEKYRTLCLLVIIYRAASLVYKNTSVKSSYSRHSCTVFVSILCVQVHFAKLKKMKKISIVLLVGSF